MCRWQWEKKRAQSGKNSLCEGAGISEYSSLEEAAVGRAGVCEQAEQSILVRQMRMKALIPFQFLPPLLTSWHIIDIPHGVKAEYPRWHNQLAYSERREIIPREDVR